MRNLWSAGIVGLAGLVSVGLLSLPSITTAANDDVLAKRDEDTPELVLVDDADDDDTNLKKQGLSRDANSRSRKADNDRSRNDNTDNRSPNADNDRSRNDNTDNRSPNADDSRPRHDTRG